jgi:PPOX class probable F420-dependent enzyme
MARPLDDTETRAFLNAGTRTAKLAWVTKSGRPAVTPIWFVLDEHDDGFDLVFNTAKASGKAKAFARDGRVSVIVDDEQPPFGLVKLDGVVKLTEEPDERTAFATRIGARYMGRERAAEFGARNGSDDEWLVRLRPENITAIADIAGY